MIGTRFSQRFFLNIFFSFILIVLLITTLLSYRQIENVSSENGWVRHTNQVIEATNNILSEFLEVESLTRGFMISGDTELIKNLDDKIKNVFKHFNVAKELTKDNSQQKILFSELEPILRDKFSVVKKEISLKLGNNLRNNIALQLVSEGQALTVRVEQIIKAIHENEALLLKQREEQFLQDFNARTIFSNSVNIVNLCLLVIIIIFLNNLLSRVLVAQERAKKSEFLLKGIINGSKEYIAALDLDYNIIACNAAFEKEILQLFGKRVTTGMNFKDALAHLPEEQKKAVEIWDRALNGEEFTVIEKFGSDEKTRSEFEITYSAIYNEKNELIGASHIVRDVGKRIEAENKLKNFNKDLENQAKEMTIINDMNNQMRSAASIEEILSVIAVYLEKLLPFCSGAIYLMNHSRNYLEMAIDWNNPQITEEIFSLDQCWGLRQGKIYFFANASESIPCQHVESGNRLRSYFCVPLLGLNKTIGILYLQFTQSTEMEKGEASKLYEKNHLMIQSVSDQISLSISNLMLNETLKTRSTRDLLTNLYNRSYLSETFDRDIQRAKRNKTAIAVVMMDLDYFKDINDRYGHEAGDTVLREISKLLLSQLRKSDMACRYGGEEITLILYDTDPQKAIDKVEELRKKIAALEFRFADLVTVTASFGIAIYPKDGDDSEQLIKAADDALYQSKKAGRNRVTVYSQEPTLDSGFSN